MAGHPAAPADVSLAECRLALNPADLAAHFAIRHAVFVAEQGLFERTDRDERDRAPRTRHVLAWVGGAAVGTVRFYPMDELGAWKGDRLAVLPAYRRQRVGAPLVRYAAAAAGSLGGGRMVAHIQPQNVAFFRLLGWHEIGDLVSYASRPHQLMAIGLYPWPARRAGREQP